MRTVSPVAASRRRPGSARAPGRPAPGQGRWRRRPRSRRFREPSRPALRLCPTTLGTWTATFAGAGWPAAAARSSSPSRRRALSLSSSLPSTIAASTIPSAARQMTTSVGASQFQRRGSSSSGGGRGRRGVTTRVPAASSTTTRSLGRVARGWPDSAEAAATARCRCDSAGGGADDAVLGGLDASRPCPRRRRARRGCRAIAMGRHGAPSSRGAISNPRGAQNGVSRSQTLSNVPNRSSCWCRNAVSSTRRMYSSRFSATNAS